MTERELLLSKAASVIDRLRERGVEVQVPETDKPEELFKFQRMLMQKLKADA